MYVEPTFELILQKMYIEKTPHHLVLSSSLDILNDTDNIYSRAVLSFFSVSNIPGSCEKTSLGYGTLIFAYD